MPIEFKKGNIFDQDVEVFVNPVNCVGVLGAGLALAFSKEFPWIIAPYKKACQSNELKIGAVQYLLRDLPVRTHSIINFPTKDHWKNKSLLSHIKLGLKDLRSTIIQCSIHSIAIPPLGCGLGGLKWPSVKKLITSQLSDLPTCLVIILEPTGGQFSKGFR